MTPEILDALTLLSEQVQPLLAALALVFARVGPVFALVPAFGERAVPVRIRLMAALAMCVVVAPAVADHLTPLALAPFGAASLIASETLIGLILGLSLRLLVMALQIAGTMAAQSTSLAQAFGAGGVDPQPAISHLLFISGLALATLIGLPERLAHLLVLSYDLFPAGQWPNPADLAAWGTQRVAQCFALAFSLAAPFVIGSALYNLALGAINRAMPQLMVAFIGAPALTLGGLALLLLAAPLMLAVWLPVFQNALLTPLGAP